MKSINDIYSEQQQRLEVPQVTPNNIEDMFGLMIEAVRDGNMNPLDLFAISKQVEDIANKVKKEVQDYALEEAEKNPAKTFNYGNYKVTKIDGKRMINYSNIEEWVIAKENLKEIEDKYKSVTLSPVSSLDETTGEVLQRGVVTFSKSSISIK